LSVLHQSGGATVDGASYTYDNAGNSTAKTNKLNNVAVSGSFIRPIRQKTANGILLSMLTTPDSRF